MVKKIFSALVLACLLAGLGLIANKAIKQQEHNECIEWQQENRKYQGWYSTDWQKEQCLNYGIELH